MMTKIKMATTRNMALQTDFLLCKLCKLPFNEPKYLSCQHTFCKRCLTAHVQKNGVTGKDGTVVVFCPLCTQICDLPKGGVQNLKDNRLLKNLLDMVSYKATQNCDLCRDEGETSAATYCCIKCEDFLCDECAKMHKRTRITRDHVVINVGSMMDTCRVLKGKAQNSVVNARLLNKFGRHGNVLFYPSSVCVSMADEILVSNDNNTISVFTLTGTCTKVLKQSAFYGSEENYLPNRGIAVTSEGYIAVAMRKDVTPQTAHMATVQSFAGREISVLSAKIKAPKDCQPHGIAVTPDNYTVVSDIGRHCVYVFDPDMRLAKCFGKKGSRGRRQFKTPYYVAVTPGGGIVVSDYGNHCVKVFDMKGRPKLVIGRMGRRPGEFIHPMGVCTDRFGNLFVADRDNHRVQMFSASGQFLGFIVDKTCKDGVDIRPQDVALTTYGHLVVVMRGIEGIDMAEVHIYQYGSSRQTVSPRRRTSSATDAVQHTDVNPSMPRRLPPLSPNDALKPSTTPDLLTPAPTEEVNGAQDLMAMYSAAALLQKDNQSHVCTIL